MVQANTQQHLGAHNAYRVYPKVVAVRLGHAAAGVAPDQCSHAVLSIAWGVDDVVAIRICEPVDCSSLMVLIAEQGTLQ